MLYHFKNTAGEEKIPKELLDVAKGVVFLTIAKCGFMFTARYGTGIVIAKLPDGSWSAPSAITISGIGWGLQVGAELTDVMLILSSDAAVQAFKSKAQISVGAELGVSVGPVGRSVESDVTAGSKGAAHAFSYAHSKGLFFGASLETTALAARNDVNRVFYGEKVKPSMLLSGEYPKPKGAEPLYIALEDMINNSETGMPSNSSRLRGDDTRGRGNDDNYGNWTDKSIKTRERSLSPTPMHSRIKSGGNQYDDFGLGYAGDEHEL
jgi:lipid-binding SYLF domain-containing protein